MRARSVAAKWAPPPLPRNADYRDLVGGDTPTASARDAIRRRLLALADVSALGLAVVTTGFASGDARATYPMLALLPLWLVQGKVIGLYDRDAVVVDKSTLHEIPRIVESLAIGGGLICLAAPIAGTAAPGGRALEFVALAGALMIALRAAVRAAIVRVYGPERAVIVGSGRVAALLVQKLRAHPRYGARVVGYVDVSPGDRRHRARRSAAAGRPRPLRRDLPGPGRGARDGRVLGA